jgi:hypothetical protein
MSFMTLFRIIRLFRPQLLTFQMPYYSWHSEKCLYIIYQNQWMREKKAGFEIGPSRNLARRCSVFGSVVVEVLWKYERVLFAPQYAQYWHWYADSSRKHTDQCPTFYCTFRIYRSIHLTQSHRMRTPNQPITCSCSSATREDEEIANPNPVNVDHKSFL